MPVYIYFDTATYDVIERDVKVKTAYILVQPMPKAQMGSYS